MTEITGLAQAHLYYIERDKTVGPIAIERLASALDVPTSELKALAEPLAPEAIVDECDRLTQRQREWFRRIIRDSRRRWDAL